MPVLIRLFTRRDRDQLVMLVNAHLAAVLPGASISVQALLSQLESEPGEFIVDRWVRERATLVAAQDQRIVAAAHLRRYGDGPQVWPAYARTGEIAWFVCYPDAPFWPGAEVAGSGATSLITYLSDKLPASARAFYARTGFAVLTRTRRGWPRPSD